MLEDLVAAWKGKVISETNNEERSKIMSQRMILSARKSISPIMRNVICFRCKKFGHIAAN